ncbi:MAG TPA: hypothetical protein VGS97_02975 [Actinocrinis sp.]|uniref:hypothetical protein n=1 Tax=Actinocrinis sp. TaxID=1920516 RepID=UPI002DDD2D36|nr:hypothetical protein [Actinocrinis sp.]HEV2343035.1 hypothetical protein [Actinocrinis sp.]
MKGRNTWRRSDAINDLIISGIIAHDFSALIDDFQNLQNATLEGSVESSAANAVNAQITMDGQTLITDCDSG